MMLLLKRRQTLVREGEGSSVGERLQVSVLKLMLPSLSSVYLCIHGRDGPVASSFDAATTRISML